MCSYLKALLLLLPICTWPTNLSRAGLLTGDEAHTQTHICTSFSPSEFVDFPSVTFAVIMTTLLCFYIQMEAKVVLAKLLQRFEFSLVPGQSFDIKDTGTLRPMSGVICNVKPCS